MLNRHTRSSQALRIKCICSTFEEYRKHSQDLIKRFVEKGYNELIVKNQIERADHLDRSLLLKYCKPKRKGTIPFSLTYNPVLPNIKEIINKHWHILSIDSTFKEIFYNLQPIIAFRKNTSLKQLIGTNTIRNNQKFLTPTQTTITGQCTPCYTSRSLCCHQVLKTTTFTSTQTRKTFTINHQVTCHSNYVIYLLILCKIQYVGKSETAFNIRLNNYRKDIKKSNATEACKDFNNTEHKFSKHGKFMVIETTTKYKHYPYRNTKIEIEKKINFWIKKLKTLTP